MRHRRFGFGSISNDDYLEQRIVRVELWHQGDERTLSSVLLIRSVLGPPCVVWGDGAPTSPLRSVLPNDCLLG